MYETFYNLNANPFRLTPDPRFCFSHSGYKHAREYLVYALKLGEGFIVVTGQPGTGKTMLAETFLKELEVSRVAAERIVASNLGAMGLLRSVAFAFGLPAEKIDRATLRSEIEQFFIRQVRGGRRVLLIIDEAQGLPHSALEELRLLTDLHSGTQPLLQIFLIGQDGLRDLLQVPDMNQFQQRVIATAHLKPLALAETAAYIEYRLIQAGWKGDPVVTGEAVLSIYRYSHGIPRHINKLCNRLLLIGYGKEKHIIDQEDVEEISVEMQVEKLTPISGNEAGRADLPGVPLETELPDNGLPLDSLALGLGGSAIETPTPVPETEPNSEREACVYPGEAADWPVEVAAEACRPEQPEHVPASGLALAGKASAILHRWSMSAKRSLRGIGRLLVKPLLMAGTLATAFVSTTVLTRFQETQPVAGGLLIASRTGNLTETTTVNDDRQVATIKPVATVPETPTAMDDGQVVTATPVARVQGTGMADDEAVPLASPVEKPVAVAPEPDEPPSNVAGPTRPVTAVPSMHPVPVPDSLGAQIPGLLGRARQSLERDRLLVPAGDSAYDYYNRVLALDPGNHAALDGIGRVADRYAVLAGRASEQQDSGKARLYVERGLRVQPDNATLIILKTTMDYPPASGAEVVERSVVATGEQPESLFSQIKDFFVNGRHSKMTSDHRGVNDSH